MTFSNKILILILFLLNAQIVFSQSKQFQGKLVDSLSGNPIKYCEVIITNKQDSTILNSITNSKGIFKIDMPKHNSIIFNCVGFISKEIFINDVQNGNLGEILLNIDLIELGDITIEARQKYSQKHFDRISYNIREEKIMSASNIYDLLKDLPGVVVDETNQIRFKGKEATIHINEQPIEYLYPKTEMIPIENIDKIELIDISMQTGGNGKGGIINIKYKRVQKNGISGLVSANINAISYNYYSRLRSFINLNYKIKKITFFSNIPFQNQNRDFYSKKVSMISNIETPRIQNSTDFSEYQSKYISNLTGFIYSPSHKTKIFLSGGFLDFNYGVNAENKLNEEIINTGMQTGNYSVNTINNFKQVYNLFNFSIFHSIDTLNRYIKILANYKNEKKYNNNSNIYNFQYINSIPVDSIYNINETNNKLLNKLNYSIFYNHPFSNSSRWNLSYSANIYFKNNDSKYKVFNEQYSPLNKNNVSNIQQHTLSTRFGFAIKNWKFDAGINLNDKYIKGYYSRYKDTTIYIDKNYFKILPSATIIYVISDTTDIKLSFSKTTKFPNFPDLLDYVDKNEPYFWSSGNSELTPANFYSIYLGYSHEQENWNFSAESFLDYTNNEITNVYYPITSLRLLSKPENFVKKSDVGIDVSAWIMFSKNINMSLSTTISYTNYNIMALENIAINYNLKVEDLIKKQFGYNIKYNTQYKYKKNNFRFFFSYYSKKLTFDGYNFNRISSSCSFGRKFFKNKLSLSIGVNNIFDGLLSHGKYTNNFGIITNTLNEFSMYKRKYFLSLKYQLGRGDRGTKKYVAKK